MSYLQSNAQKVVKYDLTVTDTLVNYSGKEKRAIAVNGQIPMPTLTFTEGDIAEIVVHNKSKNSTSLHWHGIYLPNKEDGVPHLTQMPIMPEETFTYRFPIIQNGTHWYHSHSMFQEQIGMYGSLILLKKNDDPNFRKGIDDLPAVPIILSEWTDIKPENVQRMLRNASDWAAIKKGTVQSYSEAIAAGHFKTKIGNEWKRMLAMDVSDVYYDKFLINGKNEVQFPQFSAGDKVRLRIANGGASSYFWLTYAGGKITVVANDGNDVEPIEVDRLIIGVSETYDVIITIPENDTAYEFLATPEDRTSSASMYFGNGIIQLKSRLPKLKYFEGMKMMNDMMKMDGSMDDMGMEMSYQKMDMNNVMYPEVSGDGKMDMKSEMDHSGHKMEMKSEKNQSDKDHKMDMKSEMDHSDHKMEMKSEKNQSDKDHKMDMQSKMDHSGHKMDMKSEKSQSDKDHKMDMKSEMDHSEKSDSKMEMNSNIDHSAHSMNMDSDLVTLNYGMLKSAVPTTLPKDAAIREINFELTGNMNRYVWSMDNKVLSEVDKILIKKGEIVRITLHNNSMMRHPMHLHGHDFRVLNGKGEYSPLKNVLDIMPMETDTIEFLANNEGDWFFHCHILYHMMAGMNRVFAYDEQEPNPYLPNKEASYKRLQSESNMLNFMAENDFASNGNDGQFKFQNTRWSIGTEWRLGYNDQHGYETETHIGRYIGKNQWLMPFVGFDWRYRKMGDEIEKNLFGQKSTKDRRAVVSIGAEYTLPMLVIFQTEIFTDGKVRFQLMREDIPITPRLRWAFMVNTDKEYMTGLKYILTRNLGLSTHYDSDMGIGFGATINY